LDLLRLDAARAQAPRTAAAWVGHGPAGTGLEGERLRHPLCAEVADERVVVALGGVGEAVEQAMHALKHGARTGEARARKQRGAQARLRSPAGMHSLGPGAFRQILDDAARHRAD